MTKYSRKYIATRDIDWFAKVSLLDGREFPVHVASRGTKLPAFVNNKERNRAIQCVVAKKIELPLHDELYEDVHYVGFENVENVSKEDKMYLSSFGEMAHQGFYSFDTIEQGNQKYYMLVAYPSYPKLDDVTLELLSKWQNRNIPDEILEQLNHYYGIL